MRYAALHNTGIRVTVPFRGVAKEDQQLLYNAYEIQRAMLSGASTWASVWAEFLSNPTNPLGYAGMAPVMASALEVFAHA